MDSSFTTISKKEFNKKLLCFLNSDKDFNNVLLTYLKDKEYLQKENNKYRMTQELANILDCSTHKLYYEFDILNILGRKTLKCKDLKDKESGSSDSENNEENKLIETCLNKNENNEEEEDNDDDDDYDSELDSELSNSMISELFISSNMHNEFKKPDSYKSNNNSSMIFNDKGYYSDSEIDDGTNCLNSNSLDKKLCEYISTMVKRVDSLNTELYRKNRIINQYRIENHNQFFLYSVLSCLQFAVLMAFS
jgi:hypothetical protein